MAALRTRNACLLAKTEAVEGVAETPSASTDAVLIENPQVQLNPQNTQTNEVTGSLDNRGPVVGGLQAALTFDVYVKGSGVAGTPPEAGKLLKACGWAEQITAAAIPAAPEACAAGGSTSLAVLGAGAASTAQIYRGMPIDLTGAVAGPSFVSDYGSDKKATLTDTMAAAIVATTNYQIPVNVLYKPASTGIPSLTMELYMDGIKYLLTGCRGTFSMGMSSGGAWKFSFSFSGMFVSKTDAAVPAAVYDATRPPIWRNNAALINRLPAAMSQMGFENGTSVIYPQNPNAAQGFDPAIITQRAMTLSADPQMTLAATQDLVADLVAGTQRIVHARIGSVAGNRVGFTVPTALFTGATPGDRDGTLIEQLQAQCIGQDSGAFICFH